MGDLDAWLRSVLPRERIVERRELTGGYSNLNELLRTERGHRYVLRRYRGTNACAKEAALAARLAGIVPVPEVVAADPDAGVLLSRFVPGVPIALEPFAVGETLARIGSVTFPGPGFFQAALVPDESEPTAGLDAWVDRCLREGNADGHLSAAERARLLRYAADATGDLRVLAGARQLVHADYNPKNLIAGPGGTVAAVLDWEFAYSSSPLFDVGNMLRDPRPDGFAEAFVAGFAAGGGELPPNWRELSRALDLYSLADFLTRPVAHPYFARAITRIRALG
ncbi:phosphotransferase [Dactylosporangium sp. CS-033363]|uniref:phosphotransferase n=1 Tax=Dactylosporangium sp. CS-033363 TaxID=3239935 RepID=UPI003D8AEAB0